MSVAHRWSLLVAGEASLVLFLLVYGNVPMGHIPLHRIQLGIFAVLGGIGWLVILWRPHTLPPLLVVAPLPILASLAVTSITSPYPSLSWDGTWQSAAYIGIAWLVAIQASHPVGRRNLVAVMGIVVTIVIAYYLVIVASAWRELLSFGFPLTSLPLRPLYSGGLLRIPAWLADVAVLGTPVVAVSMWLGHARIPALVLAASAIGAIVLSGTRSVLLLIAALSVIAATFVITNRGSRRKKVLVGIALAVVAAVGLSVVLLAGRGFDLGRSSSWASAIDRFVASPLVGTGPGTYGVGRMSDPVDSLFNLAQADALNVVLTSASDSGIVGLAGLGLAAVAYALSSWRAWRRNPNGRPIILAAALGVLVFAGHSLGEFVFGSIGVIFLLIAGVSIAATDEGLQPRATERRPGWLTAGLVAGIVVIAASSVVVVRNEMTLDGVAAADSLLAASPGAALDAARGATDASPDSVPAWWVRMVAADAAGDVTDSLAAARRIVELEGFGQEWLSLGVLLTRSGDAAGARDAIDRAVAFTVLDPVVQLNAAIYYDATGATQEARKALTRLLLARSDIEPILADNLPRLAEIAASVRGDAAAASLDTGDTSTAFLIALSSEDRGLAAELLRRVAHDPAVDFWRTIVAAWFGDSSARATHDSRSSAYLDGVSLAWSWRLAVRACDSPAADRWERAIMIVAGYDASMPTSMGAAPAFGGGSLPPRYPILVWRMDHPQNPYVEGIWTFSLGRARCSLP